MNTKKVQKKWLVILFAFPIFQAIFGVFAHALLAINAPQEIPPEFIQALRIEVGEASPGLLISLIITPIMYHCAYTKGGNALLTISLFFSGLALLISLPALFVVIVGFFRIWSYAENLEELKPWISSLIIYKSVYLLIGNSLTFLWLKYSWLLRKVNLKRIFDSILNNETYRNLFENMEEAADLKSLEAIYCKSVRENPFLEKFLKKKFKEMKRILN